jgi:hypothetical protein
MSARTFLPTVKWIFLLVIFTLGLAGAQAQGLLNFATLSGGLGGAVNAPGSNFHSFTFPLARASGAAFLAQLYIGPAGITDGRLLTTNGVGGGPATFLTGAQAGYVLGGTRVISGYAAGTTITVQLRAWHAAEGDSWENTSPFYRTGFRPDFVWAPNLIQLTLGDGVGVPPPNLVGMQGYVIYSAPEPGTWALLGLGVAALLFCRRRGR